MTRELRYIITEEYSVLAYSCTPEGNEIIHYGLKPHKNMEEALKRVREVNELFKGEGHEKEKS